MVVAVILLVLSLIFWYYYQRQRFEPFAKKVGGPQGLPLIGVFHRLLSMKDLLYTLPKLIGERKSAFFWIAIKPAFYTYDPEMLEKILTSPECINKSEFYSLLIEEIGPALLTSNSPKWDEHRKLLNPGFSHKVLVGFFPIFNQCCDRFIQELDKLVGCGEQDLLMLLKNLTLQTTIATNLGEDGTQTVGLISHAERYLSITFERSVNPITRFEAAFRCFKAFKGYQESRKIVHNFIRSVLTKKVSDAEHESQQDLKNGNSVPPESIDIVKQRKNVTDLAVDIYRRKLFSWEELNSEAHIIVAASFETSAITINSALMFLAMHPEYQEKLYDEVMTVFPDEQFEVNFKHLGSLLYMDMFISETLRVAPSIPIISRKTSKDAEIGDDLWIPQGTFIIMDLFNLHRCKELWGPNAEKFDPENFLPKNQAGKHAYSYIPFLKGPRNCIGWQYARMFLKVALSKIVRKYRISTSFRYEDLRYVPYCSMRYEVTPKLETHRR